MEQAFPSHSTEGPGAPPQRPAKRARNHSLKTDPTPTWLGCTWLTVVGEGEQASLPALAEALGLPGTLSSSSAQGPGNPAFEQEWLVIDLTRAGDLEVPGARILRPLSRSPQQGLGEAAALAKFEHLLLAPVWSTPAQGRAELTRQAWRQQPEAPLLLGGLAVQERGVERLFLPELWPLLPPGGFEATLAIQRAALLALALEHGSPIELCLWQRYRERCVQQELPLASISTPVYESRARGLREDADILAAWARPPAAKLQISVLLATHQRLELLLECLAAFARQPLPRGSFEIVVVNDGSRDGTAEVLPALRLPVPLTQRSVPQGGASKARTTGLPLCRGELILFVNDDTLPFPDTLRSHLEAHRLFAPKPVSILGTFEQPPENLRTPLMRFLETTTHVFGYAEFEPGMTLAGRNFYTCNASTPRASIDAIGGFDGRFAMLAEDTDLGIRLEQAGVPLIYRPEVRAIHQHRLVFADIRRRQPTVARAHAALVQKHPELLLEFKAWRDLQTNGLRQYLERCAPVQKRCERMLATIADLNLEALGGLGPEERELGLKLEAEFGALFLRLTNMWWSEGFLQGFEQLGISGFPEIWANIAQKEVPCTTV